MCEKQLEKQLENMKCDDIQEFSLNKITTIGKVVDVYDGDTCKIILIVKDVFYKFNCRLLGVDTPEMKPSLLKCDRDKEMVEAYQCRNKLIQLSTNCDISIKDTRKHKECKKWVNDTNTKIIKVVCHTFDKYGRLLVALYDNDETTTTEMLVSYNDVLLNEGFAKKYDGKHKEEFKYV